MSDYKKRSFRRKTEYTGVIGWILCWIYPVLYWLLLSKAYRIIAGLLELQSEDIVLDVACGSGIFLQKHTVEVFRVAGVDISDIQIRMAQRRLRERIKMGSAEIVRGDSASLPWDDNSFSAVTCNCLHCFENPELSVKEMNRVLRPGGRAVIVISYNQDETRARETEQKGFICVWTESEMMKMMEYAGFQKFSIDRTYSQKGALIVKAVKS